MRPPTKKKGLRMRGVSDVSVLKEKIQKLVREIVMRRDKGCVLRHVRCGHGLEDDVMQADHLITRSNSATFADTRLIVCLCRTCHGWKHWHQKEYEALVKTILPKEVRALWNVCEMESWKPKRMGAHDWKLEIINLERELLDLRLQSAST